MVVKEGFTEEVEMELSLGRKNSLGKEQVRERKSGIQHNALGNEQLGSREFSKQWLVRQF